MPVLFNSSRVGVARAFNLKGGNSVSNISLYAAKADPKTGAWQSIRGAIDTLTNKEQVSNPANAATPPALREYFGLRTATSMGFVTGVSGSFKEAVDDLDGSGTVTVSNNRLGEFAVNGVAFSNVAVTTAAAGSGEDCFFSRRHGIEGLLHFYNKNRVSALSDTAGQRRKNPLGVALTLGTTKLFGQVVGMQFGMLNTDFNLFAWSVTLLVRSRYDSNPLVF